MIITSTTEERRREITTTLYTKAQLKQRGIDFARDNSGCDGAPGSTKQAGEICAMFGRFYARTAHPIQEWADIDNVSEFFFCWENDIDPKDIVGMKQ
jgi:hypothetical protein